MPETSPQQTQVPFFAASPHLGTSLFAFLQKTEVDCLVALGDVLYSPELGYGYSCIMGQPSHLEHAWTWYGSMAWKLLSSIWRFHEVSINGGTPTMDGLEVIYKGKSY